MLFVVFQVEPALLTAMGNFTALQRVARILNATNLNHLLFYLAIVSCRKASTLRRLHPPEGDTFSQSDSTTYYEDMIMCSDEGSTDDGKLVYSYLKFSNHICYN